MSDDLLRRTLAARRQFWRQHGDRLADLARDGQSPPILFITCSDSRIAPEQLLGAAPGDLFMLRNVANVVPPYIQSDAGTVAAVEFAVQMLEVAHIVVCGHTDCGGIRALDDPPDLLTFPALTRWLELARPVQRDVDFEKPGMEPEARHRAIVAANVRRQLANLRSYPFVRGREEAGALELHGWVYDLANGQIDALS